MYPHPYPMIQNNFNQELMNIEVLLKEINDKLNILIKQKDNNYLKQDDNLYML
ncbi:MAG: hypothetical protein Q4E69_05945 [Bacilli bacterium]|nr:hypothetical protein [Bacilli bacterium]